MSPNMYYWQVISSIRILQRIAVAFPYYILIFFVLNQSHDASAGSLSTVTPIGASASVAINITGTGFNTTASNNQVIFTHSSGTSVSGNATAITTLDSVKGLRRLTVNVPTGIPTGTASLRVVNKISGEVSEGKSLEIIEISLPEVKSATPGTTNINVKIVGSSNTLFIAGGTRSVFGSGVSVNSTTVLSATSLIASISISSTATAGTRNVGVITNTLSAILPGAFAIQPNRPPILTQIANSTVNEGATLNIPVSATDPDGDQIALTASPLPDFATFTDQGNGIGNLAFSPKFNNSGTYSLTLSATDSKGASTNSNVIVVVNDVNRQPYITSNPINAGSIGDTYNYDVEANDPDAGNILTYLLSIFPSGMTIDAVTGLIQWIPTVTQVGSNNVTVNVQDVGGLSATQTFTVNVANLNQPPVIISTPQFSNWTQISPSGTPPTPRAYTGNNAFDFINDRLILFGGSDKAILPNLNEVWVLENATGKNGLPNWIKISATGGPPTGRNLHFVIYDLTANRLIIHGGCSGNCTPVLSDTWVLTNANGLGGDSKWIQIASSATARAGHAAGFDPINNRMIVFGGNSGTAGSDKNDVLVLTEANGLGNPQWITLSPMGTPPAPRGNTTTATYDPLSNRLIVYGGFTTTQNIFNDVWVLTNANGLGGTPAWINLNPTGAPPIPRADHTISYDSNSNRLIVFGGMDTSSGNPYTFLNDIWVLKNANGISGLPNWERLYPSGNLPISRAYSSGGYNVANNRMVIAMGRNDTLPSPSFLGDVWILNNASGNCTANQPCNYNVEAIDPDSGDTLTYNLDSGPTGMTIDSATGLLQWIPTPEQIGEHQVTVKVLDQAGASAIQTFTIPVASLAVPNVVGLDPETAKAILKAYDLEIGNETHIGGETTNGF